MSPLTINALLNQFSIWLEELHSQTAPETRLDGFDISAALFPSESKCTYLLQNVLEPFPSEYHGLYDLVHIRYMVVAFKGEQYLQAIENLLQILSKDSPTSLPDLVRCFSCTRN